MRWRDLAEQWVTVHENRDKQGLREFINLRLGEVWSEGDHQVTAEGLERRRAAWTAPLPAMDSGYWKLYIDHVLQADQGADLDFLVGQRGAFVPKDNH